MLVYNLISNPIDFYYDTYYILYLFSTPLKCSLNLSIIYVVLELGFCTLNIVNQIFNNFFFLQITYSFIFNMGIKFIVLIALLIFVRGGIPRYRYDFLTKIG